MIAGGSFLKKNAFGGGDSCSNVRVIDVRDLLSTEGRIYGVRSLSPMPPSQQPTVPAQIVYETGTRCNKAVKGFI